MNTHVRTSFLIAMVFLVMIWPCPTNIVKGQSFRIFNEDKGKLDSYLENADSATNLQQWDQVAKTGMEEMKADWELDASNKINAELLEANSPDKSTLEQEEQTAEAAWVNACEAEIAQQRGAWYATRLYVSSQLSSDQMQQIQSELSAVTSQAVNTNTNQTTPSISAWDSAYAASQIAGQEAAWENDFVTERNQVLGSESDLSGDGQQSFESMLTTLQQQGQTQMQQELNSLVYRERNNYLGEISLDTASQKYISDQGSADTTTQNIIASTQKQLATEDNNLAEPTTTAQDPNAATQVSDLTNWEASIKQLLNQGMQAWQNAQNELIQQSTAWQATAQTSYQQGEAQWQQGFTDLTNAKTAWENQIQSQIQTALVQWQSQNSTLNTNIQTVNNDLSQYTNVLNGQWSTSAQTFYTVATTSGQMAQQAESSLSFWQGQLQTDTAAITKTTGDGWLNFNFSSIMLSSYQSAFTAANTALMNAQTSVSNAQAQLAQDQAQLNVDKALLAQAQSSAGSSTSGQIATLNGKIAADTTNITKDTAVLNADTITQNNAQVSYNTALNNVSTISSSVAKDDQEIATWTSIQNTFASLPSQTQSAISQTSVLNGQIASVGSSGLLTTAGLNYEESMQTESYWENSLDTSLSVLQYADPTNYAADVNSLAQGVAKQIATNNAQIATDNASSDAVLKQNAQALTQQNTYLTSLEQFYATKANITNPYLVNGVLESSATTQNRVATTQAASQSALATYNADLTQVQNDVAALNALQGTTSSSGTQTLQGLSQQLATDQTVLTNAKNQYSQELQAFIIAENSSSTGFTGADYVQGQILSLQDALVSSFGGLQAAQDSYYKDTVQSESSANVSSFAQLYQQQYTSMISDETSLQSIKGLISAGTNTDGTENISQMMTTLQGSSYATFLTSNTTINAAYQACVQDASNPTALTQDQSALLAAIRNSYLTAQSNIAADTQIIAAISSPSVDLTTLGNNDTSVPAAYAQYATMEQNAFSTIQQDLNSLVSSSTSETSGNVTGSDWTTMLAQLITNLQPKTAYSYTASSQDAQAWETQNAAYQWIQANQTQLASMDASTVSTLLSGKMQLARAIAQAYSQIASSSDPTAETAALIQSDIVSADSGDVNAQGVVRELYNNGTQLSMTSYISAYDGTLEQAQTVVTAEQNFVANNYTTVTGTHYASASDLESAIDTILSNTGTGTGGSFDFSSFSAAQLSSNATDPYQYLTDIALGLSHYANTQSNSGTMSTALSTMISKVTSLAGQYEGYAQIYAALMQGTTAKDNSQGVATATTNQSALSSLNTFLADMEDDFLGGEQASSTAALSAVVAEWNSGGFATNSTLNTLLGTTAGWSSLKAQMTQLSGIQFELDEDSLLAAYVKQGTGVSAEAFVNAQSSQMGLTSDQITDAIAYLEPTQEKIAYASYIQTNPNDAAALTDFLTQEETLSGTSSLYTGSNSLTDMMTQYIEVEQYLALNVSSGTSTTGSGSSAQQTIPSEFQTYEQELSFQTYCMTTGNTAWEALSHAVSMTKAEWLTQQYAAANNIATTDPQYATCQNFAEGFVNGTTSAYDALPTCVQDFIAENDYYTGVYAEGKNYTSTADIQNYLTQAYNDTTFSATVQSTVQSYAHDLGLASTYYGNSVDQYITDEKITNPDDIKFIKMYAYNQGSQSTNVLWPQYSTGIDDLNAYATSDTAYATGILQEYISGLSTQNSALELSLSDMLVQAGISVQAQTALDTYLKNNNADISYRTGLLSNASTDSTYDATHQEVMLNTSVIPSTVSQLLNITQQTASGTTMWQANSSNANLSNITNLMVESASNLASMIQEIGTVTQSTDGTLPSTDSELGADGITAFRSSLGKDSIISGEESNLSAAVSAAAGGQTAGEQEVGTLVNTCEGTANVDATNAQNAQNTYNGITSSCTQSQQGLVTQENVLAMINVSNDSASLLATENASVQAAQETYDNDSVALQKLQAQYAVGVAAYQADMQKSQQDYASYESTENSYQTASAVWQYANTPYLGTLAAQSGSTGSSFVPTQSGSSSYVDLDSLPKPDALNNLNTVAQSFASAYVTNQSNLAAYNQEAHLSLMSDPQYSSDRTSAQQEGESFTDLSRASAILQQTEQDLAHTTAQDLSAYTAAVNTLKSDIFQNWGKNAASQNVLNIVINDLVTDSNGNVLSQDQITKNVTAFEDTLQQNESSAGYSDANPGGAGIDTRIQDMRVVSANTDAGLPVGDSAIQAAVTLCIQNDATDFVQESAISTSNGVSTYSLWQNLFGLEYWTNEYNGFVSYLHHMNTAWHKGRAHDIRNHRDNAQTDESTDQAAVSLFTDRFTADLNAVSATLGAYISASSAQATYANVGSAGAVTALLQNNTSSFGLTTADVSLLKDSNSSNGSAAPQIQGATKIDISGLKTQSLYTDENGQPMTARKNSDGTYSLYTQSGRPLGVTVNPNDPTSGYSIITNADGTISVDRFSYDTQQVIGFAQSQMQTQVTTTLSKLQQDGTSYDQALALTDQEALLKNLCNYALQGISSDGKTMSTITTNAAGTPNGAPLYSNAYYDASYAGYSFFLSKLVYNSSNGSDTSIGNAILKLMESQSQALNQNSWQLQQLKLSNQENEWLNTVGYIENRGAQDWANRLSYYTNQWNEWSYDAKNQISQGVQTWDTIVQQSVANMKAWRKEVSTTSTKTMTQGIYDELTKELNSSLTGLQGASVAGVNLTPDTDKIMQEVMQDTPVSDLGVLLNSSQSADVVAGIMNVVSLGGTGKSQALQNEYQQETQQYDSALADVQGVQELKALQQMAQQFNDNIAKANKSAFDNIETSLIGQYGGMGVWTRGSTNWQTPGQWDVRYCTDAPLIGSKSYKHYDVDDIQPFTTDQLAITPMKGIGNQVVDLSKPNSYIGIDPTEFSTMVSLEEAQLTKRMQQLTDPNLQCLYTAQSMKRSRTHLPGLAVC